MWRPAERIKYQPQPGIWPTREQAALVNSIRDDDKRAQAKITQAYNLMRTDPAAARELLQDPDIPSQLRQQAEMAMQNVGNRY